MLIQILPVFLQCPFFCSRIWFLVVVFLWSPLIWESSSVFSYLSWSWQFGWLLFSYFIKFLSICVWSFLMVKVRWWIFGKTLQKRHYAFFQCIISSVHDVNISYYWWCPLWSFGKGNVCCVFPLKNNHLFLCQW